MLARLGFADPDKKEPLHDLACQYLAQAENLERLARMTLRTEGSYVRKDIMPDLLAEQGYGYAGTKHVESEFRYTSSGLRVKCSRAILECPINKGEGQYKTTIGFIDLCASFECSWREQGKAYRWVVDHHVDAVVTHLARPDVKDGDPFEGKIERRSLPEELRAAFPGEGATLRGRYVGRRVERLGVDMTRVEGVDVAVPQYRRDWIELTLDKEGNGAFAVEVKITPTNVGEVLRQIALYREYQSGHTSWFLASPYQPPPEDIETLRNASIVHVRLGDRFQEWVAARKAAPPGKASPEI
jgi:hypothetical protein